MSPAAAPFSRNRRKIAPFVLPEHPGESAGAAELERYAAEKAASLNQHVIGYGELAEREWRALGLAAPDMGVARRHRLERIRAELRKRDLAGIVVYDPLNVRYATNSTDMQLWCTHNAVRYAFVATDGPVILWDFHHCEHLSQHLDLDRRDPSRQGLVLLRGGAARPRAGEAMGRRDRRHPEGLRRGEPAARHRQYQSHRPRGAGRGRHHGS